MTGYPTYPSTGTAGDNEIVVDTRDLRPIRTELTGMGIATETTDQIPEFRVALLRLEDVGPIRNLPEAMGVRQVAARSAGREPLSDLDVVMTVLRRRFSDYYDRLPRMGKNRSMQVVGGLPHWAAANLPDPVAAPADGLFPPADDPGPRTGLKVGVLDTAMFDNPVLEKRYQTPDALVSGPEPLPTWAGHATFIVGRILRRAPGADVLVRKVLDGEYGTATAWQLACGMASFLGSGVEVLNLSLGCFTVDDEPPFLLARATETLTAEMVVVAAAGNHGENLYPMPALGHDGTPLMRPAPLSASSPMWPAALDGVAAVGSADIENADGGGHSMTPAAFTPRNVPWIELWAPGVDVVSTYLNGPVTARTWSWGDEDGEPTPTDHNWVFHGYARWSGTSMSAGDVTGEIAAVAQAGGLGAQEAYQRIRNRRGGRVEEFDVRPWI